MSNSSSLGVEKCLEKFSQARNADAQAICELAMYNYEEMRHLVNQKSFYWRRMIDIVLNRVLGKVWTPLYTCVTFSAIPYSKCIENKKWQDKVICAFGHWVNLWKEINLLSTHLFLKVVSNVYKYVGGSVVAWSVAVLSYFVATRYKDSILVFIEGCGGPSDFVDM